MQENHFQLNSNAIRSDCFLLQLVSGDWLICYFYRFGNNGAIGYYQLNPNSNSSDEKWPADWQIYIYGYIYSFRKFIYYVSYCIYIRYTSTYVLHIKISQTNIFFANFPFLTNFPFVQFIQPHVNSSVTNIIICLEFFMYCVLFIVSVSRMLFTDFSEKAHNLIIAVKHERYIGRTLCSMQTIG